jgi:autotransporter-associated beta strand protein
MEFVFAAFSLKQHIARRIQRVGDSLPLVRAAAYAILGVVCFARGAIAQSAFDPYRPYFHVAPPVGWINDPNGLIQTPDGTYQFFYQYNPTSYNWGNMHWGHTTSVNLLSWTTQPIALYNNLPYNSGGCFSGSAIEDPAGQLALVYTAVDNSGNQRQAIAYANDATNLSFSEYAGNPVITNPPPGGDLQNFRDPKVWQYNGTYYMITGCVQNSLASTFIYSSSDLTNWTFRNTCYQDGSGGGWECPNLFPLGNSGQYVLMYGTNGYDGAHVGTFNYQTCQFSAQTSQRIDYGEFYAAQQFSDNKGRSILVGWVTGSDGTGPSYGWQGYLSIPRVMSLLPDGTISTQPIPEIASLRQNHLQYSNVSVVAGGSGYLPTVSGNCMELLANFDLTKTTAANFGLDLLRSSNGSQQVQVSYDKTNLYLTSTDGTYTAPMSAVTVGNTLNLHILVDASVVEVFGNDGRVALTARAFDSPTSLGYDLFATGGSTSLISLNTYQLTANPLKTWTGGGGNANWTTDANWADGVHPGLGAVITLAGSGGTTNNNLDPTSNYLSGLSFAASAGSFTVTGSAIWLQGSLSNLGPSVQTLATPLVLDGQNVPINTASDLHLNGPVSELGGSFGIVKSGSGTLYLAGSNSYSGGTTIAAGNLVFATSASVPGSGRILIQSGAALNATGAYATAHDWLSAGVIDTSSSGAIAVGGSDNEAVNFSGYNSLGLGAVAGGATFNGTITPANNVYRLGGGGVLTVTSLLGDASGTALVIGGAVALSGSNTYSGGTTVLSGGSLELARRASLYNADTSEWTSGNIVIGSGGALILAVGGSGQFTAADVQSVASLGTSSGGFQGGSSLGIDTTGGSLAYSAVITNPNGGANKLSLIKLGANVLNLGTANTFTGSTLIAGGAINLGNVLALQNSTVIVNSNGGLTFAAGVTSPTVGALAGSGNVVLQDAALNAVTLTAGTNGDSTVYSGVVSGNGALTVAGSGTLTMTGANTYSGITTVLAGGLQIGSGGSGASLTSSAINYNAASLTFDQADNSAYAGTINGSGVFSQQGAGQLTLRGNTATGTTLISGGTLVMAGTHSAAGLQASGGVIVVSGSVNVANSYFYIGNGGTNNGLPGTSGAQLIVNPGATINVSGDLGDNLVVGRDSGSGGVIQNGGLFSYNPSQPAFYICASNSPATRATYDMNGGTLDVNGKSVQVGFGTQGIAASGTLTQRGGSIVNVGSLDVGVTSGVGVFNLVGGNMVLGGGGIVGASTYSINLGGGTISAGSNWTSAAAMTLTGSDGNITFNTGFSSIGLSGVLSGSGGLAVAGNGTLTLSNANTFTGTTSINSGTLAFGVANALPGTNSVNIKGGTWNLGTLSSAISQLTLTNGRISASGGILTAASDYQLQSGTVAATLAGNVNLLKSTSGTVVVTTSTSYTGSTIINGGTLKLSGNSPLPAGTVAYYSFSSAANLGAESSGNGYNLATGSGSPAFSPNGVFGGGALSLNGASTLVASTFPAMIPTGTSAYTISAWIDSSANSGGWVSWGVGSNNQCNSFRFNSANGLWNYWWNNDFGTSDLGLGNLTGAWHFVVATFDPALSSNKAKFYVDGNLALQGDHPLGLPNVAAANFRVGTTTANENFTGLIDNLLIANRALTPSEISTLYTTNPSTSGSMNLLPATTNVTVAAGATFDLGGATQQIAALAGASGGTITSTGGAVMLIDTGGGSYSGTIRNGGSDSPVTLRVTGGTLVLSGTNTYSGGTNIVGGDLVVTRPYSLPDAANISLGNLSAFAGSEPVPSETSLQPTAAAVPEPRSATSIIAASLLLCAGCRFYARWRYTRRLV